MELRCERCGKNGFDVEGEVALCTQCLALILREWLIKHQDFGSLAGETEVR
jgi:hypothetical protein